jgi:Rod binding domain-containing protein
VFTALLQGKKVLAANDGFMLCDILVNEPLRQEIAQILTKLEGFGMIFCQTDQLHATFQKMISGGTKPEPSTQSKGTASEKETPSAIKLITAKVVHTAVDNKKNTIRMASGGMITPLARDLAKEYSIKIIKTNE